MPDYERVPEWTFGEVVRHTRQRGCLALVLGWDFRADYNPTESIVILLAVKSDDPKWEPGMILNSYCGWWEPADG